MFDDLLLFIGLFFGAKSHFFGNFLFDFEFGLIVFCLFDFEEVETVGGLFNVIDVEIEGGGVLGILFGGELEFELDSVLMVEG